MTLAGNRLGSATKTYILADPVFNFTRLHATKERGMRFENQVFTTDVTLDYNEFVDCEFRDCAILFAGGQFSLVRATFQNVRFGLGDAANRTLEFMRLIRSVPNGEQLINELLNAAAPPKGSITIN